MLLEKVRFFFFFLHLVNPHLQINLHLTHWLNEDENFQHDCLFVPAFNKNESDPRQIISYCMGQLSSKLNIIDNNIDQKFTFEQLSKQNITTEQLYLWSAPIDLIEQYQFYLNQLTNSEKTSLGSEIYYNCTLPYFGPKCEYLLYDSKSYHSSLDEIIQDYYRYNRYEPTLFTCYIHFECNRGPSPSCLDWAEICDGKVDCLNGEYDEEHCWQLEIEQCNENEYQCSNGQCIPKTFFRDDPNIPDCLDQSDEDDKHTATLDKSDLSTAEPTFRFEDISCVRNYVSGIYGLPFLASLCLPHRRDLLLQTMFSFKSNSVSDECWTAWKCMVRMPVTMNKICLVHCDRHQCNELVMKMCPNITYVPAIPLFFGHIYLGYSRNSTRSRLYTYEPEYVCYNDQLLHIYDDNKTLTLFNNDTCRLYRDTVNRVPMFYYQWTLAYVNLLFRWLKERTIPIFDNCALYDKSMLYKCMDWPKYISKRRLFDGIGDCPNKDDEEISLFNKTCLTEQTSNIFKCDITNKCIPIRFVRDGNCQCTEFGDTYCDDEDQNPFDSRNIISFQIICDGFIHLTPQIIHGEEETDETNCEKWPLIHIYNRCDGFWNNLDGSDEINCNLSPVFNCSPDHHICVSSQTNKLICLPIEKANDGIVDCLGAVDEPKFCRRDVDYRYPETFYCTEGQNYNCLRSRTICDNYTDCQNNEDEQACQSRDVSEVQMFDGVCTKNYELYASDAVKVLCDLFYNTGVRRGIYFTLDQRQYPIKQNIKYENSRMLPEQSISQTIKYYQQRCHRGLDLQVWLDKTKNVRTNVCLCPPSYYGDICQYQNERISLTLQFGITSDSIQIPFLIIISLIDDTDQRIIHSSEQFNYLLMINCQRKFNIYLLYSTRPKDQMKNYSIHFDIYEKLTLNYRLSIIKSFNLNFLPVHRLAFQIDIPHLLYDIDHCSDNPCIHGKCIQYFNDPTNRTFCQCEKGWSGRYCTIEYNSTCSSDALCLGKLANNRSLCVCPINKMGPRCLIDNIICQNNPYPKCFNGGQCIPIDEYAISTNKFVCICSNGFTGDQCEIVRTKLIISFDQNISLHSSIFVHFIEVKFNSTPVRTTTLKTVLLGQNSVTISWSLPFHIVFIQLSNKDYYLLLIQKIYKQSSTIKRTLNSSDRCLHIKELFNQTIANYTFLRRIKSYHIPCQIESSSLSCFYDERQFCLCEQFHPQRVANCFNFNHNTNLNCSLQSSCLNGGQCYQEHATCPRISICACPICYYGAQCQFSTNGFSLSLDAILGYQILPNIQISKQPRALLISSILSLILIVGGVINGVLSLITFKNESTRKSGCGIYLLCSSIITLLTMIIFSFKFLILLFSQMGSIKNILFLNIQCHSIDFILRCCLTMDQWLTAVVAIERVFIIIKGVHFNKNKSKLIAKWTIIGLILITIVTNILDPIYRRLFEENQDDEKRIYCILDYPSVVRIVNLILTIFNFIVPFVINVISAILIIIMSSRQIAAIHNKQKYKNILNEQIQEHKNLLISPCVLIILGIPRIIISFASDCMKSSRDSWLFLLGYFISLIPPLLTFILFVLPSTTYKQAFRKAISQYKNIIRRH